MLRSEHSIVRYDFHRQTVQPDRLVRGRDNDYLAAAKILLRLYRDGIGKSRQMLHRDVEVMLQRIPSCPPRRIAAFCKLLDDQSIYHSDKQAAVELRRKVFALAAPMHPIVQRQEGIFDQTMETSRQSIGESLGMSWQEIDAMLFSDVIELQTLQQFQGSTAPGELLSIYNVAQTQAALYRAMRVRIETFADFKTIVRHIKLAGLMHRITRVDHGRPGYRLDLDGPQSSLRETTRYGVRFAAMLPKLLACRDWHLVADVIGASCNHFQLRLSHDDGLKSSLAPPDEFESGLEQQIQKVWDESPVDGWTMERETELLFRGQTVLTPDFVLRQSSADRRIYLEVVGYWTPEYLAEKCRRLTAFVDSETTSAWLLMFPKQGASSRKDWFSELSVTCIEFDRRADPRDWILAIEG
jgi:predicted nuclease of restriction endonuclease-like RecB superfamily